MEPTAPSDASTAADRREAADELIAELRRLLTALGRTTAPAAVVEDAATSIAEITRALQPAVLGEAPTTPTSPGLFGMVGPSSPLVPELTFERTPTGGLGRTVLNETHAGHPHIAHGGITAVLLDEVMGRAAFLPEASSVTSGLSIRYLKPVPIGQPLEITASLGERSGPWLAVTGTVATTGAPDIALAEAQGIWYYLAATQASDVLGPR